MSEMPREDEDFQANGNLDGSSRPLGGSDEAGADRNLLLGLLAFQNGFIEHHTLVDAVHAWIADKSKPLGETLRGWGVLDQGQLEILSLLVDQHLKTHGSASRSLGKLESTMSFLDGLGPIEDEEVRRRLAEAEAHRARSGERRGEGLRMPAIGSRPGKPTFPEGSATSSSPRTRSLAAGSPSRRSAPGTRSTPPPVRGSCSKARSPATSSTRASCRSTAWDGTPTAARIMRCG